MAKCEYFEYLIKYLILVSFKRTLTGKLVLDGQNLLYCFRLRENVQKPSKTDHFQNKRFLEVLRRFLQNGVNSTNSDLLAPTYP